MSRTQEQNTGSHKRPLAEADLPDTSLEARPLKRARRELHSAAFYDSLSKVWLTRRALKELNRRTSHINSGSSWPAPTTDWQEYRARIWQKQLQRFARHGGPELSDLRGYPEPRNFDITRVMSSNHVSRSSSSRKIKSTTSTSHPPSKTSNRRSSAYDNDFEQHLIDNRIFPEGYEYPDGRSTPEPDLVDLHELLAQPRQSLSPSRFTTADFREFKQANARVLSEGKVMSTVLPVVYGKSCIANEGDLVFTRLEPIADDTIVNAKPDFYDGAFPADINKKVRDDIGNFIIPTGHPTAPVLPNFFLEAKAPKGGADIVKRQACYYAALGARAMHQLQSYGHDELVHDGHAYTISTTYHAGTGTLQMYTTHPGQASDGTTEYHMTQVNGWNLSGNATTFRQGVTAFRNARDWAQEQRNSFISTANDRARAMNMQQSDPVSPTTNNVLDDIDSQSDTYLSCVEEDEDKDEITYVASRQPIVQGSSTSECPDYNDLIQTADNDANVESEKSLEEIALNINKQMAHKRRHKSVGRAVSKASRQHESTRRRHRTVK